MGIASLIIGVVALVVGFVPFCGFVALLPAVAGLVLGILEVKKKSKAKQPKGMGLAGIILNAVAIVVIIVWVGVVAVGTIAAGPQIERAAEEMRTQMEEAQRELEKQQAAQGQRAEEAQQRAEEAQQRAEEARTQMPALQKQLMDVVRRYRREYKNAGDNEAKKTDVRFRRGKEISSLFQDGQYTFEGWLGEVKRVSTNQDGAVTVRIDFPGDKIGVTNGAPSLFVTDAKDIDRSHELYPVIMLLNTGQSLLVSGRFLQDKGGKTKIADGIAETSLTEWGSMDEPVFYVVYTQFSQR